jgi:hypothetical protein
LFLRRNIFQLKVFISTIFLRQEIYSNRLLKKIPNPGKK